MRTLATVDAADLAWASAGLVAGGPLALLLAGRWIQRSAAPYVYDRADDLPARGVALVPGARVHPSGDPFPILADRLETAWRLLEAGRVQRVRVSGCSRAGGTHDEPAGMVRWLAARGVPAERIEVDREGDRTLGPCGARGRPACATL